MNVADWLCLHIWCDRYDRTHQIHRDVWRVVDVGHGVGDRNHLLVTATRGAVGGRDCFCRPSCAGGQQNTSHGKQECERSNTNSLADHGEPSLYEAMDHRYCGAERGDAALNRPYLRRYYSIICCFDQCAVASESCALAYLHNGPRHKSGSVCREGRCCASKPECQIQTQASQS